MKYDVVIRCRNEIEWLPRVINSIYAQSVHPSSIIIVDNGMMTDQRNMLKKRDATLSNMTKMNSIIVMR